MSTLSIERETEREFRPLALRTGPLLVAVDGRAGSDAALSAAFLLAGPLGAEVEIVTARERLPSFPPLAPSPDLEATVDARLLAAIRKQVAHSPARDAEWPVQLLHGVPADAIARHAAERDARMIVLARGPRDVRHRLLGGNFAMRLAQLSDTPIFAVVAPFHHLPRRVLVALDFSPRSIAAARDGMALTRESATVWLAHVVPGFEHILGVPEEWEGIYASALDEAFAAAQVDMRVPETATVETLRLHGDPARQLLTAAGQVDADLIISGTHGMGFVQRMLLGSVAAQLLRAAPCSVLIVPNGTLGEHVSRIDRPAGDREGWDDRLRHFTELNAGRRAVLEIDDPAIGAQAQVVDYPFVGAVYEPRAGRVELMLGGRHAGRPHLTHAIADLRSIDVVKGGDGRDRTLRVEYGGGQALLTFTT